MKILSILVFVLTIGCSRPATVLKSDYQKLTDSIEVLNAKTKIIPVLQDSIVKLNLLPIMSHDQFIQLYKYERLNKYYLICKRNQTQWKYYKGWSIRVFEQ